MTATVVTTSAALTKKKNSHHWLHAAEDVVRAANFRLPWESELVSVWQPIGQKLVVVLPDDAAGSTKLSKSPDSLISILTVSCWVPSFSLLLMFHPSPRRASFQWLIVARVVWVRLLPHFGPLFHKPWSSSLINRTMRCPTPLLTAYFYQSLYTGRAYSSQVCVSGIITAILYLVGTYRAFPFGRMKTCVLSALREGTYQIKRRRLKPDVRDSPEYPSADRWTRTFEGLGRVCFTLFHLVCKFPWLGLVCCFWLVCGCFLFWIGLCFCFLPGNLISIPLKLLVVDRPCLALVRQCRKKMRALGVANQPFIYPSEEQTIFNPCTLWETALFIVLCLFSNLLHTWYIISDVLATFSLLVADRRATARTTVT